MMIIDQGFCSGVYFRLGAWQHQMFIVQGLVGDIVITGSLAIPDVQGLAGDIVLTGSLATPDVQVHVLAEGIVMTGNLATPDVQGLAGT